VPQVRVYIPVSAACRVAIEKTGGCDHVTCRCGRAFNYSEHLSPPAAQVAAAPVFPLLPATFEVAPTFMHPLLATSNI
jgi:hypothetical protein